MRLGRWTWVHFATLAVIVVVLAEACRGQWFFGDEWDFIVSRGLTDAKWGLWRPHNEHWSTLPILWWRATNAFAGLRSYWPYLLGLFALHVVVVHCAWRLMRSSGVGAALATAVALVIGTFGAGAENMTWAFQVGFVGSLAAGMVLVLAVDDRGAPSRVATVAAGAVVSLMFSGISVVMVGSLGLAALARWGWRKALAATAPAAVVYVAWLQLFGRVGLETGPSIYHGGPSDIPRYVWGGIVRTLGAPFGDDRVGAVALVILLGVVALRGRDWWARAPQLLALAAASPVMFAVISQGRGALQEPGASRYLYLTAGMLLPLVGFAAQQLVDDRVPAVAVAVAGCVVLAAIGVDELRDRARFERALELQLKGQVLASLVVADNEPTVSDRPDYTYAGDVTVGGLRRLRRNGELPRYTPTAADLAYARLALQVATSEQPVGGPCRRIDLAGANTVIAGPGDEPAIVSVKPSASGDVRVFVPYAGGNAGPRTISVRAGRATSIHSAVERLVVQLPPGESIVCGSAWIR